jgi:hypothetical protein
VGDAAEPACDAAVLEPFKYEEPTLERRTAFICSNMPPPLLALLADDEAGTGAAAEEDEEDAVGAAEASPLMLLERDRWRLSSCNAAAAVACSDDGAGGACE